MNNQDRRILVLGGTGKTGRRVLQRLQQRGLHTRVGSRSAAPSFDWDDEDTWLPVLKGMDAAYITYQPDLAVPGAPEAIQAFANLAVENGVKRLVLLSGRGEEEAQRSEQALQESGADWTIVRASWFCQNFSENFLLDEIHAGTVTLPFTYAAEPFIDADDIADVVTAALCDDRHIGQLYEVTGPAMITFAEAIARISIARGRNIRFVEVTTHEYVNVLKQQSVPDDYIDLLVYLFTTVLDGRNAHVTDGVWRALGREPRSFRDYVRDTAATGVWSVPGVDTRNERRHARV